MQRRDFVRAVISASLVPKALISQEAGNPAPTLPAPVPWTQGLTHKTAVPVTELADAVAEPEVRFFTAPQMATLNRLSDVLLPPMGGEPGALQAGTPLFLDFLIGSSPEPRRKMYAAGLDWLAAESRKKYNKPFSDLDDAEAGVLLKPWLRTWMNDHPPTEPHAAFINIAHDDIRHATINSKAWGDSNASSNLTGSTEALSARAEQSGAIGLYWSPIEPDLYGPGAERSPVPAHVRAVPKAGQSLPIYRR
jgi:hypothetical protein